MQLLYMCRSSCRCSSVIRLCLLDKRVYDNLIHRHTIHPSTIYIQSSLLRVQSCHTTNVGELLHNRHCVFFMCLIPHVWLKVKMLELERKTAASEDITHSHLYLSRFLSTLITCFIFLLVSFLQSDILAVIYLSFQISHKSFYLPLSFSAFFF